jgi:hypothetical protein
LTATGQVGGFRRPLAESANLTMVHTREKKWQEENPLLAWAERVHQEEAGPEGQNLCAWSLTRFGLATLRCCQLSSSFVPCRQIGNARRSFLRGARR